jgi:hypothetical protein
LPLKGAELLIGLYAIQVRDCRMTGGGVQIEVFSKVKNPLGNN